MLPAERNVQVRFHGAAVTDSKLAAAGQCPTLALGAGSVGS